MISVPLDVLKLYYGIFGKSGLQDVYKVLTFHLLCSFAFQVSPLPLSTILPYWYWFQARKALDSGCIRGATATWSLVSCSSSSSSSLPHGSFSTVSSESSSSRIPPTCACRFQADFQYLFLCFGGTLSRLGFHFAHVYFRALPTWRAESLMIMSTQLVAKVASCGWYWNHTTRWSRIPRQWNREPTMVRATIDMASFLLENLATLSFLDMSDPTLPGENDGHRRRPRRQTS